MGGGSTPRPGRFTPEKTWYLGGPQSRSGRVRKISPPPGFHSRTVQPVASRYNDYAIPAHSRISRTCVYIYIHQVFFVLCCKLFTLTHISTIGWIFFPGLLYYLSSHQSSPGKKRPGLHADYALPPTAVHPVSHILSWLFQYSIGGDDDDDGEDDDKSIQFFTINVLAQKP